MSEQGFIEIAPFPLQVEKGDRVFLIRLPRNMDAKMLHGKKVDVKKQGLSTMNLDDAGKALYFDFSNNSSADNVFRPVISSEIDGSSRIGPSFSSTITIKDSILELPSVSAEDADDLPIEYAYVPRPQIQDLRVHSLPIGSVSTVASVLASKVGSKVSAGSKAQKRTHEVLVEVDTDAKDRGSKKKKSKKHDK